MGSVTREISGWLRHNRPDVPVTVVDPRGTGPAALSPVFLAAAAATLGLLRASGSNLLHVQVSERGSFARKGVILRLAKALGMATVLHHHGAEFVQYLGQAGPSARRWVRQTVLLADINIVLSELVRKVLVNDLGAPPDKVRVLHNAVADLGIADRAHRASEMHFVLIGNLTPRKGVSEFLQALKQLVAEGRRTRATLAGGGEISRYQDEACALGLERICTFTGWLDPPRVKQLLRSADALVLPSHNEGLPMVVLEALSAGVPIVATSVGAIPEVLVHGRDAWLLPPGKVSLLVEAMRGLSDRDDLRQRLRLAGRARYEEQFTIDAYMQRLLEIYGLVLARSHQPTSA